MSVCPWCGEAFETVRRGGSPKRFCSAACKNQWNAAARAFGCAMETQGVLNLRAWIEGRQNAPKSTVHAATAPKSASGVAEVAGMLEVISLGAGVQSTTMAFMAAHGEIAPMPDYAIFADTGAEPAAVYEHLEWLRSPNVLPFPVEVVRFSDLGEDIRLTAAGVKDVAGRDNGYLAPPFFTLNEDGSQGMLRRGCTSNYKIRPIQRHLKVLLGRTQAETYRGETPVDMMDKPLRALPTSPQAQQQQEDRLKGILAA